MKERHGKHMPEHKAEAPKGPAEALPSLPGGEPAPALPPGGMAPLAAAPAPVSEVEEMKNRLLRLQADFENFRKRTARERAELSQRANEELVAELLPALDHFELGIRNARAHEVNGAVIHGFQLVYDQLMGALEKFGLKPLDVVGKPFDPHLHEAVAHLPSDEHPADVIVAQTRQGYLFGGKLLRAGQVVVSSGPAASGQGAAPSQPAPPPSSDAGETE
ncbi:MAG: nucleotide exchange factor GrpE [Verrucomicrobiota bacterium]